MNPRTRLSNARQPTAFASSTKRRYLIPAVLCFVVAAMFYPITSTVVPTWRVHVVDVNGLACQNMRVTQSWGHYSLYLGGNSNSQCRLTDSSGYVLFPQREVRARLLRRLFVPVIAHILVIAHGSVGADAAVWAVGIKDVAWLSYKPGKPLPDEMRVERCVTKDTISQF